MQPRSYAAPARRQEATQTHRHIRGYTCAHAAIQRVHAYTHTRIHGHMRTYGVRAIFIFAYAEPHLCERAGLQVRRVACAQVGARAVVIMCAGQVLCRCDDNMLHRCRDACTRARIHACAYARMLACTHAPARCMPAHDDADRYPRCVQALLSRAALPSIDACAYTYPPAQVHSCEPYGAAIHHCNTASLKRCIAASLHRWVTV